MRVTFILLSFVCACNDPAPAPVPSKPPAPPPAAAQKDPDLKIYEARGTVKEVGPEPLTVTIAHERIEGFMDAMTMPFKVADAAMLSNVKAGDAVTFTLEYKNSILKITRLGR